MAQEEVKNHLGRQTSALTYQKDWLWARSHAKTSRRMKPNPHLSSRPHHSAIVFFWHRFIEKRFLLLFGWKGLWLLGQVKHFIRSIISIPVTSVSSSFSLVDCITKRMLKPRHTPQIMKSSVFFRHFLFNRFCLIIFTS